MLYPVYRDTGLIVIINQYKTNIVPYVPTYSCVFESVGVLSTRRCVSLAPLMVSLSALFGWSLLRGGSGGGCSGMSFVGVVTGVGSSDVLTPIPVTTPSPNYNIVTNTFFFL